VARIPDECWRKPLLPKVEKKWDGQTLVGVTNPSVSRVQEREKRRKDDRLAVLVVSLRARWARASSFDQNQKKLAGKKKG